MKTLTISYLTFILIMFMVVSGVVLNANNNSDIEDRVLSGDYFIMGNTVFKCTEYFKGRENK